MHAALLQAQAHCEWGFVGKNERHTHCPKEARRSEVYGNEAQTPGGEATEQEGTPSGVPSILSGDPNEVTLKFYLVPSGHSSGSFSSRTTD